MDTKKFFRTLDDIRKDRLKLTEGDVKAILKIEKLINKKIPEVKAIESSSFGYVRKNNRVIGLGLYKQGLTSLPDSIGNLSKLEELELWNNNNLRLTDSTKAALIKLKEHGCSIDGVSL